MRVHGGHFDPDFDGASCPLLTEGEARTRGQAFLARWRYWARWRTVRHVAILCAVLVAATAQASDEWQVISALIAGAVIAVLGEKLIETDVPMRPDGTAASRIDRALVFVVAAAAAFVAASMAGLWPRAPLALILAIWG